MKWLWFYLYAILDIFSRYVVGWMVAERENAAHVRRLPAETCAKHAVAETDLVLHNDRRVPMTAKATAQLLADLGVKRSLSRPHVSDDNPFSDAQFNTVKYHPSFAGRFGSVEHATAFCRSLFGWYNTVHRHAGIAMLTVQDVLCGRADEVLAARVAVLGAAYARHPDRFVRRVPVLSRCPRKSGSTPRGPRPPQASDLDTKYPPTVSQTR